VGGGGCGGEGEGVGFQEGAGFAAGAVAEVGEELVEAAHGVGVWWWAWWMCGRAGVNRLGRLKSKTAIADCVARAASPWVCGASFGAYPGHGLAAHATTGWQPVPRQTNRGFRVKIDYGRLLSTKVGRKWGMKIGKVAWFLALGIFLATMMNRSNAQEQGAPAPVKTNPLTPEEEGVILRKGTERPFSGKYTAFNGKGFYLCRHCDAILFRSTDKFDSECGWPSFDAAVPGAVRQTRDADGRRMEITCARCGGHLGHVFTGEHLTAKDTRFCVNSISLDFVAADKARLERAHFAAGCFWGVQYFLERARGVVLTAAGYMGGTKQHPTYQEVCAHTTGHAEAVEVAFDPLQTSFEAVAKLFFEIHDPAQTDGQGPDIGEQYRSVIFYADAAQRAVAEKLIQLLSAKGMKVATKVEPAGTFWRAEDYHQFYYDKNGHVPYCHFYTKRF
jgi:peptide methionine sulfoxide reductase msrA/msrB